MDWHRDGGQYTIIDLVFWKVRTLAQISNNAIMCSTVELPLYLGHVLHQLNSPPASFHSGLLPGVTLPICLLAFVHNYKPLDHYYVFVYGFPILDNDHWLDVSIVLLNSAINIISPCILYCLTSRLSTSRSALAPCFFTVIYSGIVRCMGAMLQLRK